MTYTATGSQSRASVGFARVDPGGQRQAFPLARMPAPARSCTTWHRPKTAAREVRAFRTAVSFHCPMTFNAMRLFNVAFSGSDETGTQHRLETVDLSVPPAGPGQRRFSCRADGRRAVGVADTLRLAGYDKIRLTPTPGPGLDWATAALDTRHGRVECGWTRTEHGFTIEVDPQAVHPAMTRRAAAGHPSSPPCTTRMHPPASPAVVADLGPVAGRLADNASPVVVDDCARGFPVRWRG
jgi:hypothetical protein